jgi:6-pyruvoyltetrahydropterin/6-carboxytetrahydropterin synthase
MNRMTYKIPKDVQVLGRDISSGQLKYHNRRVAVSKEFTFDAAHHLHCYEGKCKNLHGHTYKLVITMSGFVNEIGIAVDFGEIKAIFKKAIDEKLDHRYLNEVLPPMNTTAENMIVWMWEQVDQELEARGLTAEGHRLEELKLYETPTSFAFIKREWMVDHDIV